MTRAAPSRTGADHDAPAVVVEAATSGGLRRVPYRLVLTAAAVSSVGDGLTAVAFPLLAARLTHDPRLIAGVSVAQHIPWFVVAPLTGALADRHDHRRFVAAVETARMAVLLLFGLAIVAGRQSLPAIYLAALALGTLETAFAAVTYAVLPAIVDGDELARANGRLTAVQAAGELFIGPAVGGIVFAAAASVPFLADGVSFAASAALLFVALPALRRPPAAVARPPLRAEAVEGVRWVARNTLLRRLALLIGCLAGCQAMVTGVLVVYGTRVLHLHEGGYGAFLAVGAVGTVVGGVLAGRVADRFRTSPILVVTVVASAVAYAVMGLTADVAVAASATVLVAAAIAVANASTMALRQKVVPAHLLGRTGNVFRMFIWGTWPLGALVGGILTQAADARLPFLVAAAAQLGALVVVSPRLLPEIRAAESTVYVDLDPAVITLP